MADCSDIEDGFEAPCPKDLPIGSLRARLGLVNTDDLDDDAPYTRDIDGNITAVHLKANKTMKLVTGFRVDFNKQDEVINLGSGPNQFKQVLKFMVYGRAQEQKNDITKLIRGRVIALTIFKGTDADAYELLGMKCGLQAVAGPLRDSSANGGYFMLNMATLDGEGDYEVELPPTVGATFAQGVAIFDALLSS